MAIKVGTFWTSKFNKRTVTVVSVKKEWIDHGKSIITYLTHPPRMEPEERAMAEEQFLNIYEEELNTRTDVYGSPDLRDSISHFGAFFPAFVKTGWTEHDPIGSNGRRSG
jgi:hypothetical protein